MIISRILFLILLVFVFVVAYQRYRKIYRNIKLGRAVENRENKDGFRNMILIAFGQQKMFKRPIPALLHLFIYVAFVITQFDLLEQLIDGLSGSHRILSDKLGWFYPFMISFIEVLSVLAFVATVIFLARRNLLRLPRLNNREISGWARRDANQILLGEILLIIGIFCLNGADKALEMNYPGTYQASGFFAVTSWLGPMVFGQFSEGWLNVISAFGWWLHMLVVLGFILYLPKSKHLHILLAFPNTYLTSSKPRGEMPNIPTIGAEVKNMLGIPIPENQIAKESNADFGSHDVFQLTTKNLLEAYTCTECGRCTSVCPAHITGKKLSPRKIMMDVRDRMEEVGMKLDDVGFRSHEGEIDNSFGFNDGRDLFSYIEKEEIRACTTCNACVESCPVMIDPLDIILQLRRYEVLTQSSGPPDWVPMYTALENNGSPWQMSVDRDAWSKEIN